MQLLTETLRNGQIQLDDAIQQACDILRGHPVEPFLAALGRQYSENLEAELDALRDENKDNSEMEYDRGWNDALKQAAEAVEDDGADKETIELITDLYK